MTDRQIDTTIAFILFLFRRLKYKQTATSVVWCERGSGFFDKCVQILSVICDGSIINEVKQLFLIHCGFIHSAPNVSWHCSWANGPPQRPNAHRARGPVHGCCRASRLPFVSARAVVYRIQASI